MTSVYLLVEALGSVKLAYGGIGLGTAATQAASDVQLTLNCEMFVQKERMGCGVVGSGRGGAL